MPNVFDSVAVNKIKMSLFNLSHMRKFSSSLGYLIPIQVAEVLPNETFHTRHEALVKFSPLLAPMMQECDMFIEDFFVPNRLVWDNWNKFITPSDDGTFPAMPYLTLVGNTASAPFAIGSLADYLGFPTDGDIPTASGSGLNVSSLVFRAYQLIWNEYYRDENLQSEVDIRKGSDGYEGSHPTVLSRGLTVLRKRCWPKDYFTSALPTTQRGGDVHLPMAGDADVYADDSAGTAHKILATYAGASNPATMKIDNPDSSSFTMTGSHLYADLSNVTSATINELRQATALQEYLELNMRVGGRINEYIYGNFAQRVPDYRIDRPQFLGGFRQPIQVSEVKQNSSTSSGGVLGDLAGNATGAGASRNIKYHSYEHGWIISLFSVLPKATYQQGLPRKFTRMEPLDYANPKFGNLGEQAILNKEIYAKSGDPDSVFGYTPRYSEYKYEPSTVHGEFKTTLNYWHMGRIFANEPQLNSDFVESDPATRPFAVVSGNDKLRVEIFNKCKALRPLPYYGTPKFI